MSGEVRKLKFIEGVTVGTPATQDIILSDIQFAYWGDPSTNGTFRFGKVSGSFVLQQRVAGTWTDIQNFGFNV